MSGPGILRPMQAPDLDRVLSWRNHPEVRRFMLTNHEISRAEHHAWFDRACADPTRELLIYESGDGAAGFVGLSSLGGDKAPDWGFYLSPDAPRGSGLKLGEAALRHVFAVRKAHKLCGQALGFNAASIKFHLKLGFVQEGVLRRHYCIDGTYHDLACFGLLESEWQARHAEQGSD